MIAGVGDIHPKDFMIMLGRIVVEVTMRHLEDPKLREFTYIHLLGEVTKALKRQFWKRREEKRNED